MTFEKYGFLSPDLDRARAAVRAKYPEHFAVIDAINETAQGGLVPLGRLQPRPDDDPKGRLLTCALWARQLHFFQGAVVNIERGMITNARTLMRSAFETLFFVRGSLMVPDFYRRAMCDYKFQQDKLLRMHIKAIKDDSDPDTADRVQRLEKVLREHHEQTAEYESTEMGFATIARLAGMELAYDTYYRALSTDSSHVNVWALMSHFNAKDGGIIIGPDVGDYRDTLTTAVVLGGAMLEVLYLALPSKAVGDLYKFVVDKVPELSPLPVTPD